MKEMIFFVGVWPRPRIPVANEGFGWNPLLKMGGGHTQYVLLVV